jgi:co-chaperonin GroES (HSP10)
MTPKLIRTPLGQYTPALWAGTNASGIEPFGCRVLVLPDPFAATTGGGIAIPDDLQERMTEASETGILIAVGDEAWFWNSDRTRHFSGRKPEVGAHIIFERYAGSYQFGADGHRYRLMDDRCIGGIFAAGAVPTNKPRPKPAVPGIARVTRPPLVAARA